MKTQAECPVCGWVREIEAAQVSYSCPYCKSEVMTSQKISALHAGYRIDKLSKALVNQSKILRKQDETIRKLMRLITDLENPEPKSVFLIKEEGRERFWSNKLGWVDHPEKATRYDEKTKVSYPPNAAVEPIWISPTAS
jgi:predicted RNA-binding Zn-ribbon protein involved in translation (DUF1610 family)